MKAFLGSLGIGSSGAFPIRSVSNPFAVSTDQVNARGDSLNDAEEVGVDEYEEERGAALRRCVGSLYFIAHTRQTTRTLSQQVLSSCYAQSRCAQAGVSKLGYRTSDGDSVRTVGCAHLQTIQDAVATTHKATILASELLGCSR